MSQNSSQRFLTAACVCLLALIAASQLAEARSYTNQPDDESLAVIPSPNEQQSSSDDIQRLGVGLSAASKRRDETHVAAGSETAVPVYVSPFLRPEAAASRRQTAANLFDSASESSQAPPNYAPKPAAAAASTRDLRTAASYGHHHGHGYGGHGYGPSGWLDMGAWTGGKGSFGWYADYPVGGKNHGHGYGRK